MRREQPSYTTMLPMCPLIRIDIPAWIYHSINLFTKEVPHLCFRSQDGNRYLDLDLIIYPPLAWFACSCRCFETRSALRLQPFYATSLVIDRS